MHEQPGDRLGSFRLLELLGSGGAGDVWLAEPSDDEAPSRPSPSSARLVLKLLQEGTGRETRHRFQREAAVLASLAHPHIVPILESGEIEGRPYYAMPFLDAEPLDRLLDEARGPGGSSALEARDLLSVVDQILDALGHAHARGVVHRDLKPSNLLIRTGPWAWLADFGLAHDRDATALTATGQAMGTMAYLSPELVRGDPPDPRSDLYQIGLLLHELFVGSLPFPGNQGYEAVMRRLRELPPDPRQVAPDLPEALAVAILRCLQPEAVDRFPEAAALRTALAAVPVQALRLARRGAATAPADRPTADPTVLVLATPGAGARPEARPYMGLAMVLVAAALAGTAGIGLSPGTSELVAAARRMETAGDLAGAEARFRLRLSEAPADREARRGLVELLVRTGRHAAAVEALGDPVEDPDCLAWPAAVEALSRELAEELGGTRAEALLPLLSELPAGTPSRAAARLLAARIEFSQGHPEEVLRLLEGGDEPAVRLLRARALARLGRLAEAESSLAWSAPGPGEGGGRVAAGSGDPGLQADLARLGSELAFALGRFEDAAVRAEAAATLAPDPARWRAAADRWLVLPRVDRALQALDRSLALDPSRGEDALLLYQVVAGSGRPVEEHLVERWFETTRLRERELVRECVAMTQAFARARDYRRSLIPRLEATLAGNPGMVVLEELAIRAGIDKPSRTDLQRAQALASRAPWYGPVWATASRLARLLGDLPEAERLEAEGFRLDPGNPNLWYARFLVEKEAGRDEAAILCLERLLDRVPTALGVHVEAAELWQARKEGAKVAEIEKHLAATPVSVAPPSLALGDDRLRAAALKVVENDVARTRTRALARIRAIGRSLATTGSREASAEPIVDEGEEDDAPDR